jgi:hypothetical protein
MTDAARPAPAPAPAQLRLDRWTVTSGSNVNSRAAVVIRAAEHDWKASAEGNGAVDALFRAVDSALAPILAGRPLLLAYDVHALAEGPGAEGRVSVRIAPPFDAAGARSDGRYTAEVTSTNTIAASVEAYVHALDAMLRDEAWSGAAADAGAQRVRRATGDPADATTEYDRDADHFDTTEWFNR